LRASHPFPRSHRKGRGLFRRRKVVRVGRLSGFRKAIAASRRGGIRERNDSVLSLPTVALDVAYLLVVQDGPHGGNGGCDPLSRGHHFCTGETPRTAARARRASSTAWAVRPGRREGWNLKSRRNFSSWTMRIRSRACINCVRAAIPPKKPRTSNSALPKIVPLQGGGAAHSYWLRQRDKLLHGLGGHGRMHHQHLGRG
jgi:hypothetical protein